VLFDTLDASLQGTHLIVAKESLSPGFEILSKVNSVGHVPSLNLPLFLIFTVLERILDSPSLSRM
jgi:hypothetical protein